MKRPLAYITAAWCGDDDDNIVRQLIESLLKFRFDR